MISGKLIRRGGALIALLMCAASMADTPFTLDGFLDDMASIPATRARFTETLSLDILETPQTSHGSLTYRRPDYLMKKVESPEYMMLEVSEDHLVIETEQERHTFSLDARPEIRAFIESYRATLSGNRAVLEEYYEATLSGSREDWTLHLQPKSTEMKSRIQHIELAGSGTQVQQIETLESSGGLSHMSITPDAD
jgi:hypothetical protein